jgi:hypothetical protein
MTTGLKEILQNFLQAEIELFPINKIPSKRLALFPDPWKQLIGSHAEFNINSILTEIWKPIIPYCNVTAMLMRKCKDIEFLFARDNQIPVRLCYFYDISYKDELLPSCWIGNPPANSGDYQEFEQKYSISIPLSYKLFTQVHNGFSDEGNEGIGLKPIIEMRRISEYLRSIGMDYEAGNHKSHESLIEFAGHIGGDAQCYDLGTKQNEEFVTVFWDHETRSHSSPQPFWSFLDNYISKLMGLSTSS